MDGQKTPKSFKMCWVVYKIEKAVTYHILYTTSRVVYTTFSLWPSQFVNLYTTSRVGCIHYLLTVTFSICELVHDLTCWLYTLPSHCALHLWTCTRPRVLVVYTTFSLWPSQFVNYLTHFVTFWSLLSLIETTYGTLLCVSTL